MASGGKNTFFWLLATALFLMPFILYFLDKAEPKVTQMQSISLSEPAKNVGIEVHVVGALNQPGVYKVSIGTKLHELLNHVSLWPNADLEKINLAQTLRDGQRIVINVRPEQQDSIININLATYKELLTLPGIGPSTAKKIMHYRDENRSIKNKQDLEAIIGNSKAKKVLQRVGF